MSNQTLVLLLVAFVGALVASVVLALHGLVPASAALMIATNGLTGAFAFAQNSSSSKSSVTPTSATVTETK